MAIKSKFFLSRLILRLYTRYLSSSYPSPSFSAVSPLILTNNPQPTVEKPPAQPQDTAAKPTSILDLKDHQTLFASLPTAKLLHASLNIHLASVEPLVDFGTWVMSAKLMAMKVARYLVLATISRTFYQHLCGGEGYKGGRDVYNKTITCWFERLLHFAVDLLVIAKLVTGILNGFLRLLIPPCLFLHLLQASQLFLRKF